jgi:hypothetical protein
LSFGPRGRAREQILRRAAWVAGALVVLTLLFVLTGHWVLAVIFALIAAAAVWVFTQARTVR